MWTAIRRNRHLSDEELVAVCLPDAEPAEWRERRAAHLGSCPHCHERLARTSEFLEQLRTAATEAADAAFPPELLALQRQRIARRLERAGTHLGPARVLRFPAMFCGTGRHDARRRWIAAAALAGLVAGLVVGRLVYPMLPAGIDAVSIVRSARSTAGAPQPGSAAPASASSRHVADEAFLMELEAALNERRIGDLRALDALTPTVVEIAANVR